MARAALIFLITAIASAQTLKVRLKPAVDSAIIELPLEMRHSVREERLGEKLARAFDFRFFWKTPSPEPSCALLAHTTTKLPEESEAMAGKRWSNVV